MARCRGLSASMETDGRDGRAGSVPTRRSGSFPCAHISNDSWWMRRAGPPRRAAPRTRLGRAGRPAQDRRRARRCPGAPARRELAVRCRARSPSGLFDRVHQPAPRALGDLRQLAPQRQVLRAVGPVEQGQVAGRAGQRLEQGPHRRDADAAGDQQHLAAAAPGGGQRPVRALGPHPGARAPVAQGRAVVADRLDGDPQQVGAGRGRQRVRVASSTASPGPGTASGRTAPPPRPSGAAVAR